MIKRMLFSLILLHTATYTMETPEKPLFSIEKYEDAERGTITYIHDFADQKNRIDTRLGEINHFWYYGATYDSKKKTYRSFDDGGSLGSRIVRRPFHASAGLAGSHAAQCYSTLEQRYQKQENAKAIVEQKDAPVVSYLYSWINFLSK